MVDHKLSELTVSDFVCLSFLFGLVLIPAIFTVLVILVEFFRNHECRWFDSDE